VRERKVFGLGKRPLPCGLFGPIDIGQQPMLSQTHDMRNEMTASKQQRAYERQKEEKTGKKDKNVSP